MYSLPNRLGVRKTFGIVLIERQQKQICVFVLRKSYPSHQIFVQSYGDKWRLLMLANETRICLCYSSVPSPLRICDDDADKLAIVAGSNCCLVDPEFYTDQACTCRPSSCGLFREVRSIPTK